MFPHMRCHNLDHVGRKFTCPEPARPSTTLNRGRLKCRAETPPSTATVVETSTEVKQNAHQLVTVNISTSSSQDSIAPQKIPPITRSSSRSPGGTRVISAASASAMAAKIAAARQLARRLAEERQAAAAQAATSADSVVLPEAVKRAEDASVAAAAQAARADAVARALRNADSSKDQLVQLRAENEALKELLMDLARQKDTKDSSEVKSRLNKIVSSGLATGALVSAAKLLSDASSQAPAADDADPAAANLVPVAADPAAASTGLVMPVVENATNLAPQAVPPDTPQPVPPDAPQPVPPDASVDVHSSVAPEKPSILAPPTIVTTAATASDEERSITAETAPPSAAVTTPPEAASIASSVVVVPVIVSIPSDAIQDNTSSETQLPEAASTIIPVANSSEPILVTPKASDSAITLPLPSVTTVTDSPVLVEDSTAKETTRAEVSGGGASSVSKPSDAPSTPEANSTPPSAPSSEATTTKPSSSSSSVSNLQEAVFTFDVLSAADPSIAELSAAAFSAADTAAAAAAAASILEGQLASAVAAAESAVESAEASLEVEESLEAATDVVAVPPTENALPPAVLPVTVETVTSVPAVAKSDVAEAPVSNTAAVSHHVEVLSETSAVDAQLASISAPEPVVQLGGTASNALAEPVVVPALPAEPSIKDASDLADLLQPMSESLTLEQLLAEDEDEPAVAEEEAGDTLSIVAEPSELDEIEAGYTVEPVPEEAELEAAEPAVESVINPTREQLSALAISALAAGRPCFTFPAEPVPVSGPMYLYYNRRAGPLAQLRGSVNLVARCGTNKWETVDDVEMVPAKDDLPVDEKQEWHFVHIDLPLQLFKFDYVILDRGSMQFDNNVQKDFSVALLGPSESDVLEMRLEALRAQDEERRSLFEAESLRLWEVVEHEASERSVEARVEARRKNAARHREVALKMALERRNTALSPSTLGASIAVPGTYTWLEGGPRAGKKAVLAYCTSGGPLQGSAGAGSLLLHLGYDGWWNKITQVIELKPMSVSQVQEHGLALASANNAATGWWCGSVEVPESAWVLDFVVSNKSKTAWDNNNSKDYHTQVAGSLRGDALVKLLIESIQAQSAAEDVGREERAAMRAAKRVYMKGDALNKRRATMHEVLYTVPATPQAGSSVDIYYNPEFTPLRGRPDIYIRGGWNRWNKQMQEFGFNSQMVPSKATGGLGYQKTTIQVPASAWGMDLVFSDNVEGMGGFFDNNGGLDYHIPVDYGSHVTLEYSEDESEPASRASSSTDVVTIAGKRYNVPRRDNVERITLRVVHVAVEMAPIAKVGGMGDVVTALGRAVQEEGHKVEVILPKYDCINYGQVEALHQDGHFTCGGTNVRVWKGVVEGLKTTFLEPENGDFWVGCVYGKNNDSARFGFFCQAALQYLKVRSIAADVIHCHDWPTAPIAWGDRGRSRCVFTIHNLSYGADLVGRAMASCELATTVSPTYAKEISGNGAVAAHLSKLYGIRNGIDPELWDPEDDPFLPMPYSSETCTQGKEAARKALRQQLKLAHVDVPVVACVTRLVAQKGIHLIKHAAWRTLERGGQFILLGSAPDPKVQGEFNQLREQLIRQYHDRAAFIFTYDEPLSHLIYAGSDFFLVPSIFEPCGLTQMIAMSYGSVPVVRKTGGLADTVFDLDHDEGRASACGMETNGFVFDSTDTAGLDYALNRGLATFYTDRAGLRDVQSRIMKQDWSWYSPALDYVELYYKAIRS